ncbi:hypothetical protein AB6A40_005159 [Gnathostoma spinigerum]|uniref:Uncharacterized protein n=1 Tax=Gnathostoma spinigerum TaxID=75299 RepID=A0ABD6EQB4_9BILA
MTVVAGIGYNLLAFSPAIVIFYRVISSDPLRIILFVLGAFFWLISLLLSALIWYAVIPLRDTLIFSVYISVGIQEIARFLHFLLLKRAQKGLSQMAASGMHISGVHTLHHARHILAVVCGLGMGVAAALFLVVNVIADFWGRGTVGLPATVPGVKDHFKVKFYAEDQWFPFTYSLSACILSMCHVVWTVLLWDGCHKKSYTPLWWVGVVTAVASHYIVTSLSFWNKSGQQVLVLICQFTVLLLNTCQAFYVMGGSIAMLKNISFRSYKSFIHCITCRCISEEVENPPPPNHHSRFEHSQNAHDIIQPVTT